MFHFHCLNYLLFKKNQNKIQKPNISTDINHQLANLIQFAFIDGFSFFLFFPSFLLSSRIYILRYFLLCGKIQLNELKSKAFNFDVIWFFFSEIHNSLHFYFGNFAFTVVSFYNSLFGCFNGVKHVEKRKKKNKIVLRKNCGLVVVVIMIILNDIDGN